jgi:predicted nuclease with TOPRIM domain
MLSAPERSSSQGQQPDWLPWLQAGLTAMLAVLFLVMMARTREQSTELRDLKERVQGLENSRALERTTALEEQLRSTVERLQAVERSASQLAAISSENSRLRRELLEQRRSAAELSAPAAGLTPPPGAMPPGLPSLPPLKP